MLPSAASAPCHVFEHGQHGAQLFSSDPSTASFEVPPPKPLLVATPGDEGEYPVLMFLHGYLLHNSFYSQLILHVASHGFIIVAPQLYWIAGPDSEYEIISAASITDWLPSGLPAMLPKHIRANLTKIALAGHSRGGKVAFALALGHARTKLTFSAVIGIDPVDGMDKGKQTNPRILTYVPDSFDLKMAAMVIGSGLGEVRKNPFFPPCAPKGVSHQDFFDECRAPKCHFVAKDFGHLDLLDDETEGIRGRATYCLCKNGKARKPMRLFVGGAMVAFMRAYLERDAKQLIDIRVNHKVVPLELSAACFVD